MDSLLRETELVRNQRRFSRLRMELFSEGDDLEKSIVHVIHTNSSKYGCVPQSGSYRQHLHAMQIWIPITGCSESYVNEYFLGIKAIKTHHLESSELLST